MTEPRKPRKASWRELPPAEMAAYLLATPTISDGVWTSEPRLPRETRSDFVRRVLLGERPESEPETPEAEAAELAGGCGQYLESPRRHHRRVRVATEHLGSPGWPGSARGSSYEEEAAPTAGSGRWDKRPSPASLQP